MTSTIVKRVAVAAILTVCLAVAGTARAQTTEPESKWSAEFGMG